ncbi:tRNA wybutosine-synthesizing protein 2 homolog isoform X4 [Ostrea edulis]|uniref:tRNA wybutosine-synthesizing protein 2 homolog isoform X4 n=2 Tax=Ostrea edulis TaxID=37623 RepID=UPI0024AF4E37|nr:tRNA wybutosine-synthesizing protein 2 homolog isoform X4 [Ostrea edulis]
MIMKCLQRCDLYDSGRRSKSAADDRVVLPLVDRGLDLERMVRDSLALEIPSEWEIVHEKLPISKKNHVVTPYQQMVSGIEKFLRQSGMLLTEELRSDIPKNWERHGDLIMFATCFQGPFWKQWGDEIWFLISKILSCKKLALKGNVISNEYRTPRVSMLLGQDGWVEHVDNGIRYTYDVTKCMFSSGNVTEKLRVASFCCENETVVDLYAGIGYFTLPYLVHSRARFVHACEWNPDAAAALRRNLSLNKVEERCMIHFGDNREHCPKDIADRVNLGLIPSSEPGWEMACAALKKCSGGILHIHSNVESKEIKVEYNENYDEACSECRNLNDCDSSKQRGEKPCDDGRHPCSRNGARDEEYSRESERAATKKRWREWSAEVSTNIRLILERIHTSQQWKTNSLHIEHVKSYAPHVDHLVLDLDCRPV